MYQNINTLNMGCILKKKKYNDTIPLAQKLTW